MMIWEISAVHNNGYGIFPFNNTPELHHAGKGTNYNLNYGFGIRLDIDFRVPKDGILADGQSCNL